VAIEKSDTQPRQLVALLPCDTIHDSGAVLSVESSLHSQNSLLTGKLTGKMNKNSCHLIVKSQFSLGQLILLPNLTGNLISENREF
jgi:hypothetical protein